ncbi:MAG: protein-glutamate O-methyltransferase CheR [Desulfobacterales bacterium]|nr:protein-glutamate O-methyltransferase CheR [Desulfobacterales bacterium]
MNNEINKILSYLKKNRGFDFSGNRPDVIKRRITNRLTDTKCTDYEQYLSYLQNNPKELDFLIDVLTINVSRFFRNTLTFEYIADILLHDIIAQKSVANDTTLRIWSAGCATGEEPYSVAILINELIKKEKLNIKLNIFATDIDKKSLKNAKAGNYHFESIKDIKYHILKKYFTIKDECYFLNPEIKDLVSFYAYDMLDKKTYVPAESVFGDFDLVFCRNLLIYFQNDYQNLIFEKLYRSLAKKGHLILGEAEVPLIKYQRSLIRKNEYCNIYQKI